MSEFVPEGWSVEKLDSITKVIDSAHQTPIFSLSGFPMVRVGDIKGGRISLVGTVSVSSDVFDIFTKNYQPKYNDILMTRVGSYGRSSIVKTDKIFCLGQNTVVVNPKSIDADYLYQLLQGQNVKNQIEDTVGGSSQKSLSLGAIKSLKILTPVFPEQQKIAAILTSVDEVIEKTQAQINKLKDLKTGMMQELLTRGVGVDGKPHTEFKDSPVGRIPKGWEVVKLSEVLTKIDSGWSPACIEVPPQTGEWGVLKVSSVTRGEFLEIQSKTLPSNLEPKEHIKVNNGDLLLTRANGVADLVGKCVMIQSEPRSKLMMSDKILRLNPNKHIYSHFLLHAFNSQEMRRQIELSWGGSSGQKNISQADIKNYLLALPSFDEQKFIGDSISQVDRVLSAKNNKLIKMNDTKKALMQDLLTGKVRVKVDS